MTGSSSSARRARPRTKIVHHLNDDGRWGFVGQKVKQQGSQALACQPGGAASPVEHDYGAAALAR